MDVQNPIPVLFGNFECGFRESEARTINEQQSQITILNVLGHFLLDGTNVSDFADVRANNVRPTTRGFHRFLHYLEFFPRAAYQNNFRARARVGEGERSPYA